MFHNKLYDYDKLSKNNCCTYIKLLFKVIKMITTDQLKTMVSFHYQTGCAAILLFNYSVKINLSI